MNRRRFLTALVSLSTVLTGCTSTSGDPEFATTSTSITALSRECSTTAKDTATIHRGDTQKDIIIKGTLATDQVCDDLSLTVPVAIDDSNPRAAEIEIRTVDSTPIDGCSSCAGLIQYQVDVSFTEPPAYIAVQHKNSATTDGYIVEKQFGMNTESIITEKE